MVSTRAKDCYKFLTSVNSFTDGQVEVTDYDCDFLSWILIDVTPNGGPYRGATFEFKIRIGRNFPNKAPGLTCLTRIYHPNMDPDSDVDNVCLNLIDEWQSTFGLRDVVQGLLFLFYNPNPEDPLSPFFPGDSEDNLYDDIRLSLTGREVSGYEGDRLIEDDEDILKILNEKELQAKLQTELEEKRLAEQEEKAERERIANSEHPDPGQTDSAANNTTENNATVQEVKEEPEDIVPEKDTGAINISDNNSASYREIEIQCEISSFGLCLNCTFPTENNCVPNDIGNTFDMAASGDLITFDESFKIPCHYRVQTDCTSCNGKSYLDKMPSTNPEVTNIAVFDEAKPSTSEDATDNLPGPSTNEDVPSLSTNEDVPAPSTTKDVQSPSTEEDVPNPPTKDDVPIPSSNDNGPSLKTIENVPAHSNNEDFPSTSTNEDIPCPSTNEDVQSPSTNEDVQSPSTNEDVQCPSTKEDVSSPLTNEDVPSTSTNEDIPCPLTNEDVQSPSTNEDVQSPSTNGKVPSPRSNDDDPITSSTDNIPSPQTNEDVPSPSTNEDVPSPSTNEDVPSPSTNEDVPSPSTNEDVPSLQSNEDASGPSTTEDVPSPSPSNDNATIPSTSSENLTAPNDINAEEQKAGNAKQPFNLDEMMEKVKVMMELDEKYDRKRTASESDYEEDVEDEEDEERIEEDENTERPLEPTPGETYTPNNSESNLNEINAQNDSQASGSQSLFSRQASKIDNPRFRDQSTQTGAVGMDTNYFDYLARFGTHRVFGTDDHLFVLIGTTFSIIQLFNGLRLS